jgi:hypothetical protein
VTAHRNLALVSRAGGNQFAPGGARRTGHAQAMTFPELFRLPTVVDLATAARAIGVHANTAYRMVAAGRFPSPVMRPGWRYIVPTLPLMEALGIENIPVYIDDVEAGAEFAARAS